MLINYTVPFPEGFGASVHFAWPGKEYIPLGMYVTPPVVHYLPTRCHLTTEC